MPAECLIEALREYEYAKTRLFLLRLSKTFDWRFFISSTCIRVNFETRKGFFMEDSMNFSQHVPKGLSAYWLMRSSV